MSAFSIPTRTPIYHYHTNQSSSDLEHPPATKILSFYNVARCPTVRLDNVDTPPPLNKVSISLSQKVVVQYQFC